MSEKDQARRARPEHSGGDQESTARRGAQAKEGIVPQPEDPVDPLEEHARAEAEDEAMRKRGFGDHKGSRV